MIYVSAGYLQKRKRKKSVAFCARNQVQSTLLILLLLLSIFRLISGFSGLCIVVALFHCFNLAFICFSLWLLCFMFIS